MECKMNYILTIDTTNPEKTAILLAENLGNKYKMITRKTWKAKTHQSEELLPAIDKLLRRKKVKTETLGLIIVCVGPGSFTGIRVGVATANAMAFALEIPVIGIKAKNKDIEKIAREGFALFKKGKTRKGIIAKPFYDKKPNITTPKNK
ncbi:MAG: tRNA (adenosine(37)-N6)-threonylcarbamoyltransferase complex dimerization subunit type 1 TsaB [Candidatus Berkelbacteria bacterium]|nr:tRNA (adenosine(37)-N6)-threonylcarbamoyltransferase complex dimerization subunit type 1 TsaB [Candidatus Berkelbacteria bacterium]